MALLLHSLNSSCPELSFQQNMPQLSSLKYHHKAGNMPSNMHVACSAQLQLSIKQALAVLQSILPLFL